MASLVKQETGLTADLEKMNKDLHLIQKYLQDLTAQHQQLLADLQKQFTENNRLAAELTQLQVDLAKRIEGQAASRGADRVVPVAK
jgi:HPt (histidine-containing phosphotransfer) domain-containing protein